MDQSGSNFDFDFLEFLFLISSLRPSLMFRRAIQTSYNLGHMWQEALARETEIAR